MNSMYSAYLRESLGQDIRVSDKGFLIYGFNCIPGVREQHCYIIDIFTTPEHRNTRSATELADSLSALAKAKGITALFGSVSIHSKTPDLSLQVLQRYGMKLYAADGGTVWFRKEI